LSLDEAFARVIGEKEARLFRPSASQIDAAAKEYGYIEIVAFPSVDAILAAAIAVKVLKSNSVGFSLRLEPVAPRTLEEPSLLLGYPASVATDISSRRPSALIGYGERPPGILPVAVTASTDSSVAALAFGVFSEIAIVGSFGVYAVAAGYWRGLDKGKRAEFIGVENMIIEMLMLENKVESFFNLRLYRWPEVATEKALHLTLLPFLPGLSGRGDRALEYLRGDPRLEPLVGKTLTEVPEQAVAVLGEKLYELIKATSRVPRRPTEVIGNVYYSRSSPLPDLREASLVLANYASTRDAHRLAGIAVDEAGVAADAHYAYRRVFGRIVDYVEPLVAAKLQSRRIGKLETVPLPDEAPSLPIVERILGLHGVIGQNAVAISGNRIVAETLLDKYGYNTLAGLVERGCARYIEGTMYMEVVGGEC